MNASYRGDQALFSISIATELTGVSQQALRAYEDKGLVTPHRTGGGTRRYSTDDIERIRHISTLFSGGLNSAGVIQVLELQAEADNLRRELKEFTDET